MSKYTMEMSIKGDYMGISKRQEQILKLLHENIHMTVEKLSELTYTSPSSIRRDLTQLQNMYYVKRTHGGVSIIEENNRVAHLNTRMTKNKAGKRQIAKKAATLLRDGMTVMLDGSTTSGFLIPHIARRKDIILFTNNMITAVNAINMGIKTHCIGGCSVSNSAALSGPASYKAVREIQPEILFFSSQSLDDCGVISDSNPEENYLRQLMLEQSKQSVFLCDCEKFNTKSLHTLTTLNEIDFAVFDRPWEDLKTMCEIL